MCGGEHDGYVTEDGEDVINELSKYDTMNKVYAFAVNYEYQFNYEPDMTTEEINAEAKQNKEFEREKKYEVNYKGNLLKHNFYADFVVFDKIILEVKAQNGIVEDHFKQTLNYLAISKMKLALLINFGNDSLQFNRIVL
jgi:GxxExxY protein